MSDDWLKKYDDKLRGILAGMGVTEIQYTMLLNAIESAYNDGYHDGQSDGPDEREREPMHNEGHD